jgi:hypothetical protein
VDISTLVPSPRPSSWYDFVELGVDEPYRADDSLETVEGRMRANLVVEAEIIMDAQLARFPK